MTHYIKTVTVATCIGLASLALGMSGCTSGVVDSGNPNITPVVSVDTALVDSTRAEGYTGLTGTEYDTAQNAILGSLQEIRKQNGYFQIQDGEESYTTFFYNSHGESVSQNLMGQYTTVFRNDNKSIVFSDTLVVGADIDLLSSVENSFKIGKNNGIIIERADLEESDTYAEYRVSVIGWENVTNIYNVVDPEFAAKMVSHMKETVQSENFGLIYYIMIAPEGQVNLLCNLSIDGEEFTSWIMNGYLGVGTWKLSADWYELETPTDATDEEAKATIDRSGELINSLMADIDGILKQFAIENDIDISQMDDELDASEGVASGEREGTEETAGTNEVAESEGAEANSAGETSSELAEGANEAAEDTSEADEGTGETTSEASSGTEVAVEYSSSAAN